MNNRNRRLVVIGGLIVLLVVLPAAWYLGSPLFLDRSVDDPFPFELPAEADLAEMSEAEMTALEEEFMAALPDEAQLAELSDAERVELSDRVMVAAAAVMSDREMEDPSLPEGWSIATAGEFVGADSFHQARGRATVYRREDERILRFEEFEVTNGPDLHVILTRNPAPANRADVGSDYIDLGPLRGNVGNQNYALPAGVDLTAYPGVVIYCVPFHVVFATASLPAFEVR